MAKNQSTSKPQTQSQGTCRNIFRAFRRRVSPSRPLAPSNGKLLVEFNHSNNNNVVKRAEPMKPGPVNTPRHQQQDQQGPKGGVKVQQYGGGASNKKFTDFIDQVKNKIKANSSFVADDENEPRAGITKRATTRRDSFNDRVSHFINRAKLKIRTTTTSVSADHGDGKLQSYTPR
ncbi:hypothetical protein CQW23_16144 [Capsicum baccatum]|uniref:Uncharacterized protein n=1 Tax=Capsicum baccatum TaxID=33114 RepID=A0A2G2WP15_CAPBA|nr:hypothetical protein CQW23_16144 [Capsicum baccatum]